MESLQKCRLTDVFANLEVGHRQDSHFQLLRHLLVFEDDQWQNGAKQSLA